ncbi:Ger(x)C family spore germination protein [Bacillus sp. FJAT-42315]|uniref:Ger(x)C family spore germination protein n=1 Tax=Bacillus sp. FJAT-42315 TaxID=2014077 RepID=UPI000C232EB7|nr:Ger(x)C family spore germination protein [Bacillus sp. FJAT-42315]
MKKILFWSALILILVTNYKLVPMILEDTLHISAVGYDLAEDDQLKATASVPFFPPGEDVTPMDVTFTTSGNTSSNVKQLFQTEAQKPLSAGRLNDILYSKDLAKKGIFHLVKPFSRDPNIGRGIHLAIVTSSTEELLTFKFPNAVLTSRYLSDLMDHGLKDIIPVTNLHSFLSQYYGEGQDPFLPLLNLRKKHIQLKGLALFKDDRYVGSLSYKDSYLFKLLYEKSSNGTYNVKLDSGKYMAIENVSSKVKYHITGTKEEPKITIEISLLGQIIDASGISLKKPNDVKNLEDQWTEKVTQQSEDVVKKLQKLQIDPLGIGEKVRSKHRNFNMKQWHEQYPETPINVKINVEIMDTGIVE